MGNDDTDNEFQQNKYLVVFKDPEDFLMCLYIDDQWCMCYIIAGYNH